MGYSRRRWLPSRTVQPAPPRHLVSAPRPARPKCPVRPNSAGASSRSAPTTWRSWRPTCPPSSAPPCARCCSRRCARRRRALRGLGPGRRPPPLGLCAELLWAHCEQPARTLGHPCAPRLPAAHLPSPAPPHPLAPAPPGLQEALPGRGHAARGAAGPPRGGGRGAGPHLEVVCAAPCRGQHADAAERAGNAQGAWQRVFGRGGGGRYGRVGSLPAVKARRRVRGCAHAPRWIAAWRTSPAPTDAGADPPLKHPLRRRRRVLARAGPV
jgi:hypothetical protein